MNQSGPNVPAFLLKWTLVVGIFLSSGFMASAQVDAPLAQTGMPSSDDSPRWALPMDPPIDPMMGDWYIRPDWTSRLNLQDLKVAQERLPKIVEEMKRLNDSTRSGQFRWESDVSEDRIWFAPETGYVSVYLNTCGHWVDSVEYGRCEIRDDGMTLFPESQGPPRKKKLETLTLARVFQGNTEYLVRPSSISTFCWQGSDQKVNRWMHYWRFRNQDDAEFDRERDVLRVPARYRRFIPKSLRRKVRVIHPAR